MLNDWHALGSVQYRKWHVYDMAWASDLSKPFPLENYVTCGAPFGGPIAMYLDPKRLQEATGKTSVTVSMYSSSGHKISEMEWTDRPIVSLGWSDQELLVVVAENGLLRMFDLYCRPVYEMQLLLDFHASVTITECHFYGNGVACMTSDEVIRVVEGISNVDLVANPPRMYSLKANLTIGKVTAMTIIPPLQSRSGFLEVILGTSNSSALVVHEHGDETITEDQVLQTSIAAPIIKLSVSPNGRFIACYRKDGVLTVMASNFSNKIIDFDTQSASKPIAIEWCGKDCVVMQWRNTGLVMVGPFGDWLNFPYDTAGVYIVPELDCCRIITSTSCEILQLVPPATIAALEIGSMEPAALILDAMDAFEGGDPKADEHIRTIAAARQLQGAVQTCIEAASAEFDPAQQQRLLKAASYAKAFCPDLDPSDFVETAKKLRVLNEVRKPEVGLPLTVQQYNRLTAEVLVGRLTSRKKHFLALKICDLLKLKNDRILMDWACEKVKQMATSTTHNYSDEEINRTIKNQLEPYGRISYLRVAKVAYKIGRPRLATIVLDKEQHPGAQIPVLLEMNEEELALQKAINSGDYDLIYFTLVHLEGRVRPNNPSSLDNFFRIVLLYPEAANLLRIYYRNKISAQDRSPLHKLLVYGKNFQEAGNAAVNQALQQVDHRAKLDYLGEAVGLYAQGKESTFFRTITEEQIELLETQKNLERRCQPRRDFADLSLHETLQLLIEIGQDDKKGENRWTEAEVQKLVKRFKVSEKTVYHLRIQCFCQRGDWEGLSRLASEKKPPVGFRPFAVSAIKYGAPDSDIERYVEKVYEPKDKFELYMEMRSYTKAAEVAYKMKDEDLLREVSRACNDSVLERQIGEMINRL